MSTKIQDQLVQVQSADAASPDSGARHDRHPDETLAAVEKFGGEVLLDLDETLYLRNSTEDFINCAAPGLPVLIGLRILDLLKPWLLTGGIDSRDWWRVRLSLLLCPWIGLLWRRRVKTLGAQHRNQTLIDAVHRSRAQPLVLTNGFEPIVRPLIAAMGLGELPLIACSLSSPDERIRGKLALALKALGEARVSRAMVITDSLTDLPLLHRCALPCRTLWPGARYEHALHHIYLPGMYLSEIKRPGQRYVLNGILLEDFALWVCASVFVATLPAVHVLGLGLMLLSFWTVYERGYVDNDEMGARYEENPYFSPRYGHVTVATPRLAPWLWALTAGGAGVALVRYPGAPNLVDLGLWFGVLAATHATFLLYNRVDNSSRVLMFPWLQLARSAAFVAVLPITLPAALAIGAHVLARWLPYHSYRMAEKRWPQGTIFLSRLAFFTILMVCVALVTPIEHLLTPTALALMLWNLFQARGELRAMLRNAHRIDRS